MKEDLPFLLTIAFAVLVKLLLSPFVSVLRAVTTALAAVFCAYIFTDPITDILGWTSDRNRLAVAAVLGLTGEHLIRHIIEAGQNPERGIHKLKILTIKAFEVITIWRRGEAPTAKTGDETDHKADGKNDAPGQNPNQDGR